MDELLAELYTIRKTKSELNNQENYVKWRIHTMMNQQGVNQFNTENYTCFRYIQERESIKRGRVDQTVWDQLATTDEFPILKVVPN